jgi:hypothetical protein
VLTSRRRDPTRLSGIVALWRSSRGHGVVGVCIISNRKICLNLATVSTDAGDRCVVHVEEEMYPQMDNAMPRPRL